ncbi:unnamed protein product [Darwinula stevensoni]|uniref:CAP-Gly domain-containing protein n=1 Tax=Darwinula stevensoni TaxID=69355 RepID=A0A7R8XF75_9CRUS|nr:unnamed protein product [Darwinula stevensoni]CAG0894718.1 unnamed protein product [Darwinula stevensoni]
MPHASVVLTEDTDQFMVGQRVYVGGTKSGSIVYIGEVKFAPGEWAGVVLDEPIGKNDGSVGGVKYFQCAPNHGVFSRLTRLTYDPISPTTNGASSDIPTTRMINSFVKSGSPTASEKSAILKDLKLGDRVMVTSTTGTKVGFLRYLGPTEFAPGEWAGVELDDPIGKNDGSVAGKRFPSSRYFECRVQHGLFAPIHKLSKSPYQRKSSRQRRGSGESLSSMSSTASANRGARVRLGITSLSGPQKSIGRSSLSGPSATTAALQVPSLVLWLTLTSAGHEIPPLALNAHSFQAALSHEHIFQPDQRKQASLKEKQEHVEQLLQEVDLERAEVARVSVRANDLESQYHTLKLEQQRTKEELEAQLEEAHKECQAALQKLKDERLRSEELQFRLDENELLLADIQGEEGKREDIAEIDQKRQVEKEKSPVPAVSMVKEQEMSQLKAQLNTRMLEVDALNEEVQCLKDALKEGQSTIEHLKTDLSAAQDALSASEQQKTSQLAMAEGREREMEAKAREYGAKWDEAQRLILALVGLLFCLAGKREEVRGLREKLDTSNQGFLVERDDLLKTKELEIYELQEVAMMKEAQLSEAQDRIGELEKLLQELPPVDQASLYELQRERDDLLKTVSKLEVEMEKLEGENERLKKEKEAYTRALTDRDAKMGRVTDEVERLQASFRGYQEELQKRVEENAADRLAMEELRSLLEVERKRVDELQLTLEQVEEERNQLLQRETTSKTEMDELRLQLEDLEDRLFKSEESQATMEMSGEELEQMQKLIQSKDGEIKQLRAQLKVLESEVMNMDSVRKGAAALEVEKNALEKKVVDLQVAVAHSKNSLSNGERDSALSQVDFLNSVIVDMQRKNDELRARLEVYTSDPLASLYVSSRCLALFVPCRHPHVRDRVVGRRGRNGRSYEVRACSATSAIASTSTRRRTVPSNRPGGNPLLILDIGPTANPCDPTVMPVKVEE